MSCNNDEGLLSSLNSRFVLRTENAYIPINPHRLNKSLIKHFCSYHKQILELRIGKIKIPSSHTTLITALDVSCVLDFWLV